MRLKKHNNYQTNSPSKFQWFLKVNINYICRSQNVLKRPVWNRLEYLGLTLFMTHFGSTAGCSFIRRAGSLNINLLWNLLEVVSAHNATSLWEGFILCSICQVIYKLIMCLKTIFWKYTTFSFVKLFSSFNQIEEHMMLRPSRFGCQWASAGQKLPAWYHSVNTHLLLSHLGFWTE